jgi:hypothetical protein
MSLPKVTVLYSNGNLLQDVQNLDGLGALVGTGTTSGLLGVPNQIRNLDDAVALGYTLVAEPDMYRHLQEFYGEVGGNQPLWIMIVPNTMTLAQMLDDTNAAGAKKLLAAVQGKVSLLGVFRNPVGGYNGGANYMDADVGAAITSSKTFGDARLAELAPVRMLIEGRVQNPSAGNTLTPNTSSNGYSAVVLGGSLNDGSASVGLALGRAVKFGAEVKVGKVANGPLNINQVYIGDKLLKDVTTLTTLHDAGFLTFMTHIGKSGFFFGIDNMCSTDDFKLLANGRVIDKAARITAAVMTEHIEDEIDLNKNGTPATHEIVSLEEESKQAIGVNMGAQISGDPDVFIDPTQNVEVTSELDVEIGITPKGYTSKIKVTISL